MADKITKERRSNNMARIRSVDTTPELTVRSLLHREGLRFSLHRTALPGKPDLVLKKHMAVIFVNGCFWHQHKACPEGRVPRTRRSYWVPKLEATLNRDRAAKTALRKLGWRVFTVWECQISEVRIRALAKKIRASTRSKEVSSSLVSMETPLAALEICAGAGGQALGFEMAGFDHVALVEIDRFACATLRMNRPDWRIFETDLRSFSGEDLKGIDLLCGGVPCPPFSVAGKQLGGDDERDLFPEALRLAQETSPKAVVLENVPGLAASKFNDYRRELFQRFHALGFATDARILNASDFGLAQFRPRFILVALRPEYVAYFRWPVPGRKRRPVGQELLDLMSEEGWHGASDWAKDANQPGPTLVGGSKKHGGPDLGPTRARKQWAALRVNGISLADSAPPADSPPLLVPKLTVRMTARLQGFPDSWVFSGGKTAAYRQIGNAFPPPVAFAVGTSVRKALLRILDTSEGDRFAVDCQGSLWGHERVVG